MRRALLVLGLLLAIGAGGFLLRDQATRDESTGSPQLQTEVVRRDDLVVTVRVTGNVQPVREADLTFDTGGVVQEVLVAQGQRVEVGQILARLDGEAQRIAVEQAELGVRIAELNLASLEAGPDARDLEIARANVNSAWAAYVELRDNSITEEQMRTAELRYEQALTAWDAAEQASRDALRSEESLAQVGQASFNAEIARLQLEQVREGPSQAALNSAQAGVAQAQAILQQVEAGPRQAELDRAAIGVRQAELARQRAQAAWEDTVLRAPFAGMVSAVYVQVGGIQVPGGLPAVTLVDLSELVVTVQVDEIDIVAIRPGQSAQLTFDAITGRVFAGSVGHIAEAATETGGVAAYEVEIILDESAPEIRAGMTTAATIVVQEVRDVLVVPNIYVRLDRRGGAQATVDVLDASGQLVERMITLGAQNETYSEVTSGVQEGDTVAIDLSAGGLSSFFGEN